MSATSAGEPNGFRTRLWKMWREAAKAAGQDARLIYDLRRTATRNLIRAGVPQAIAMQITGHLTEETFRRYNIVDDRDLTNAMESVGAMLGAQVQTPTVVVFPQMDGHKTGTK